MSSPQGTAIPSDHRFNDEQIKRELTTEFMNVAIKRWMYKACGGDASKLPAMERCLGEQDFVNQMLIEMREEVLYLCAQL